MIDNPIAALQALNESEDRLRSPVSRFGRSFLRIVELFGPAGQVVSGSFAGVLEWLDQQAENNRAELVTVIAEEMKYRGHQIEDLLRASEGHRRFIAEELPGLVLDGLRRAETVRSKDRISRLARILVHAAELGPKTNGDAVEEFLRIAVELSDLDVVVLSAAAMEFERQRILGGSQEARIQLAARAWMELLRTIMPKKKVHLSGDEFTTIGARLQSFGLVNRIEGITGDTPSFLVLEQGHKFIEYVKSGTP